MARKSVPSTRAATQASGPRLEGLWRVDRVASLAGLVPARERRYVWVSGDRWTEAGPDRRPTGPTCRCAIQRSEGQAWLTIEGWRATRRFAMEIDGSELRLGRLVAGDVSLEAELVLRRARGQLLTNVLDLPPEFDCPALGTLRRSDAPRPVYEGALAHGERTLQLRLAPRARPLLDLVRRASRLVRDVRAFELRVARYAGRSLVECRNEAWREPRARPWNAAELARRLALVAIWVGDEEATYTLDDGGAFRGHRIHVAANRRGRLCDAEL